MKQHRYQITVEHLSDKEGVPSLYEKPLQFEAGNHDDIFLIVDRIKEKGYFDSSTATAFAVGLKLFGEVMLENREHPLFKDFAPHFRALMKQIKNGGAG